jgi:hypothetical protein
VTYERLKGTKPDSTTRLTLAGKQEHGQPRAHARHFALSATVVSRPRPTPIRPALVVGLTPRAPLNPAQALPASDRLSAASSATAITAEPLLTWPEPALRGNYLNALIFKILRRPFRRRICKCNCLGLQDVSSKIRGMTLYCILFTIVYVVEIYSYFRQCFIYLYISQVIIL